MENSYKQEFLESLGIYELRNIARDVGILCASKYKRKELINKILTTEPTNIISRKGRPKKSFKIEYNIQTLKNFDFNHLQTNLKELQQLQEKQDELINSFLLQIMALLGTSDGNFILNFLKIKLNKLIQN